MSRKRGKRRRILQVRLEDEVVEVRSELPLARSSKVDLRRTTRAIRRAAHDRRVGGLMLLVAHPQIGWAKAAGLARAVRDFRACGKPVVGFLEGAGNLDFALACACGSLVMHPGASLDLVGLQAETFFFKDLLERMGIEAELEAVGEYKSAGEPFLRREMSPAHREALESLLIDLSQQMVGDIAEARGLAPERVKEILEGGPYLAEEARALRLVDHVDREDACERILRDELGSEVVVLPEARYASGEGWLKRLLTFRRQQIAVLYAVGVIASGEHRRRGPSPRVVSSRGLRDLLERVRESRRVKAVVIRVESPGGAAVASDVIWREIARTREKKPVVISMGDVAASGGYYIATAADAILAESSTLTGSIGILGGKLVARRLLDKLGVQRETIALSGRAGFRSPTRSFSPAERERVRDHLRFFYEKMFLPRVAEGRRLSLDKVQAVAGGRVWTGRQGMERGLVDELGDLEAAIQVARTKAHIAEDQKVRVVSYAKRPRLRELLSFGVPWGSTGSLTEMTGLGEMTGNPWSALVELIWPLVSEEVLFLMPWIVRIK
jgi:protease IV